MGRRRTGKLRLAARQPDRQSAPEPPRGRSISEEPHVIRRSSACRRGDAHGVPPCSSEPPRTRPDRRLHWEQPGGELCRAVSGGRSRGRRGGLEVRSDGRSEICPGMDAPGPYMGARKCAPRLEVRVAPAPGLAVLLGRVAAAEEHEVTERAREHSYERRQRWQQWCGRAVARRRAGTIAWISGLGAGIGSVAGTPGRCGARDDGVGTRARTAPALAQVLHRPMVAWWAPPAPVAGEPAGPVGGATAHRGAVQGTLHAQGESWHRL